MRKVTVRYTVEFEDRFEAPEHWVWDGTLGAILDFTDLPFYDGTLVDWEVED